MDELLRTKWAPVYGGNSSNHGQTISNYLTKYAKYIYTSAEYTVEQISGEEFFHTVAAASHTAQGMDHWSYTDLLLFPASTFHYLALLLSLVEAGFGWPQQLLLSKAHLLSKKS